MSRGKKRKRIQVVPFSYKRLRIVWPRSKNAIAPSLAGLTSELSGKMVPPGVKDVSFVHVL